MGWTMLRNVQRDPLLILILSLYLLLLAFFILLNNISQVEMVRAKIVAGSLDSTFSNQGRPTRDPSVFTSSSGAALGEESLADRLGALVRAELRLGDFEILEPGRLMQVRVHEQALFDGADGRVSENGRRFLGEIAAELRRPAKGVRYHVEIRLADDGARGPGAPERVLDRIRRAAALAQALQEADAPKGSVAAGLEKGRSREARFLFEVRPGVEPALFDDTAGG
jgi:hypothetical protein